MSDGDRYDAIVVGVGGMGSATVYQLARRGLDVLGIEQFGLGHGRGSSHGETRIVRRAIYEGTEYVPMADRAYELWRELEARWDEQLLYETGSIAAGPAGSDRIRGAERACSEHGIEYETLDAAEAAERFPGYRLPSDYAAVHQADGGYVTPERCILAHASEALDEGATIRAHETVREWTASESGVVVETDRDRYEAEQLVLTAGAWTRELLDELRGRAQPERLVMGWFRPSDPGRFSPDRFPVFSISDDRSAGCYGFPIHDVPGFKIGSYSLGEPADPDDGPAEPDRRDEALLRELAERHFHDPAASTLRLESCMLTRSPDDDFVLDTHPDHANVAVGAGFSGSGFKFSSVVGEVLAELAVDGTTRHDVRPFEIDRFD